jgi:hypothetical protein
MFGGRDLIREDRNMTAPKRGRCAPAICFCSFFCAISSSSEAQDFTGSKLETYRNLRGALLREGWKPDVRYGLRNNVGKPLYRFPEVLCGPKLCNAKWRNGRGEESLITLLRGDGKEEYRVAPQ